MKKLWRDQLPLASAFWTYAVLYLALANVFATGAAFAALAAGLPIALVVTIFLLPLPYMIVVIVGVWRSADAYQGPSYRATLARYAVLVFGLLSVMI